MNKVWNVLILIFSSSVLSAGLPTLWPILIFTLLLFSESMVIYSFLIWFVILIPIRCSFIFKLPSCEYHCVVIFCSLVYVFRYIPGSQCKKGFLLKIPDQKWTMVSQWISKLGILLSTILWDGALVGQYMPQKFLLEISAIILVNALFRQTIAVFNNKNLD